MNVGHFALWERLGTAVLSSDSLDEFNCCLPRLTLAEMRRMMARAAVHQCLRLAVNLAIMQGAVACDPPRSFSNSVGSVRVVEHITTGHREDLSRSASK